MALRGGFPRARHSFPGRLTRLEFLNADPLSCASPRAHHRHWLRLPVLDGSGHRTAASYVNTELACRPVVSRVRMCSLVRMCVRVCTCAGETKQCMRWRLTMGIVQDPARYQQQTFAQFYQEQPAYAPQVRAHFLHACSNKQVSGSAVASAFMIVSSSSPAYEKLSATCSRPLGRERRAYLV